MEEQFEQTTVVDAPVDGGQQVETNSTPETHTATPSGVEADVAGQQSNPGEAIKAEIARREAKIRQQYEEKYNGFDTIRSRSEELESITKNLGWESMDEFMTEMKQRAEQMQIEAEARRLGVDPSVIKEYVQPLNQKLQTYEQQLNEIKQQENVRAIQAEVESLKSKYQDFDKYEESVFQLAISKGYGLEDAYIIASHNDKLSQAKLQAEQEALQKLQTNAATSTGPLGNEGAQETFGYSSLSPAEKRALREKVKRGG